MSKKMDDLDHDILELNEKSSKSKPKVRLKSINNRDEFLSDIKVAQKGPKFSLDSLSLKPNPNTQEKLKASSLVEPTENSLKESPSITYQTNYNEDLDAVTEMRGPHKFTSKFKDLAKPEKTSSKIKRNVSVFTNAVQPTGLKINSDSNDSLLKPRSKSTSEQKIKPRSTLTREKITLEQYIEKLRSIGDSDIKHNQWIEEVLWEKFKTEESGVDLRGFLRAIQKAGIETKKDPRLKALQQNIDYVEHYLMSHMNDQHEDEDEPSNIVDLYLFKGMIAENIELIYLVFTDGLVIPDFRDFTNQIKSIYRDIKLNRTSKPGNLASYIPQLGRADPNWFGISVCTVDGQRWSTGDTQQPYTVQSTCKPINYALDITEYGAEHVHKFIGKEPSGCKFNSIALDPRNKPHNPLINSGAIMACALYHPELDPADRFEMMHQQYKQLAGGEYCGFNNSVHLSEKDAGDRNKALAHYMKDCGSFPKGTNLKTTLSLYFQSCSLEVTAESHAVMAATLANSGVCPITEERCVSQEAVRKCLSLMLSCGMYDYSGQFAFEIGIPAKSGVSGCIILVIPKICGITVFSPPLDDCGNSVRGIEFCNELVKKFAFHHFDAMMPDDTNKLDPRQGGQSDKDDKLLHEAMFAASRGDLHTLMKVAEQGIDLRRRDYDGRTVLHIAASENNIHIVEFILNNSYSVEVGDGDGESMDEELTLEDLEKDRYGRTALDDANYFKAHICKMLIEAHFKVENARPRGLIEPIIEEHMKVHKSSLDFIDETESEDSDITESEDIRNGKISVFVRGGLITDFNQLTSNNK